jgi:hypothetical protein
MRCLLVARREGERFRPFLQDAGGGRKKGFETEQRAG